jgi:hypothetical protein
VELAPQQGMAGGGVWRRRRKWWRWWSKGALLGLDDGGGGLRGDLGAIYRELEAVRGGEISPQRPGGSVGWAAAASAATSFGVAE